MRARNLALLLIAAVGSVGCAQYPSPTPVDRPSPSVVLAANQGRLATSTPVEPTSTVEATATAPPLLSATGTPPPASPTLETILQSPTPDLRLTRTVVPTPTPVPPLVIPPAVPPPPPLPTATRTPPPFTGPSIGVLQKPTPTESTRAGHYDFPHAQTVAPGSDVAGIVLAPGQTSVHRFDVSATEGTVVVTVSGPDIEVYRPTLLSPDGQQLGPGSPVGSVGRQIRAAIKGQACTWYVEVATDPKGRTPRGPYTIRVDLRVASA